MFYTMYIYVCVFSVALLLAGCRFRFGSACQLFIYTNAPGTRFDLLMERRLRHTCEARLGIQEIRLMCVCVFATALVQNRTKFPTGERESVQSPLALLFVCVCYVVQCVRVFLIRIPDHHTASSPASHQSPVRERHSKRYALTDGTEYEYTRALYTRRTH